MLMNIDDLSTGLKSNIKSSVKWSIISNHIKWDKISLTFQWLIHEISDQIVTFYPLNNIFPYIQEVSDFVLQEGFDICLGSFFAFCLFLLQKDFDTFRLFLFEAFLCVFLNIYLPLLYIEKAFIKSIKILTYFIYKKNCSTKMFVVVLKCFTSFLYFKN